MEQKPLHDTFAISPVTFAQNFDIAANIPMMQQKLPMYRCPSDTGPITNVGRTVLSVNGTGSETSVSNYIGVNSTGTIDGDPPQLRRGNVHSRRGPAVCRCRRWYE